jgi:hypothetical protein
MIGDIYENIFENLTPRALGLISCTCKYMRDKASTAWQRQAELIFGVQWGQIIQMTQVVYDGEVFRVNRTAKEIVRLETEDSSRIYGWETWIERDLLQAQMDADAKPMASGSNVI